jgi:hypothetical protein
MLHRNIDDAALALNGVGRSGDRLILFPKILHVRVIGSLFLTSFLQCIRYLYEGE